MHTGQGRRCDFATVVVWLSLLYVNAQPLGGILEAGRRLTDGSIGRDDLAEDLWEGFIEFGFVEGKCSSTL
jgi:hypothetical protein